MQSVDGKMKGQVALWRRVQKKREQNSQREWTYLRKIFFPLVMPGDSKKIVQENNASI